MNKLLLFGLLFFVQVINSKAQNKEFPKLHYSIADGLPSNIIYDIYRDSKGFLWFATDKGIAKYNGIKYETYTTSDGMPDNDIFFFMEDHSGKLWMSAYNGQLCYYENGRFKSPSNTPFLKLPIKTQYAEHFHEEKDNSLTVYLSDGKFVNIKNEHCHLYDFSSVIKGHGDETLLHVKKENDNKYVLIFSTKKVVFDTNKNIISSERHAVNDTLMYNFSQSGEYLYSDKQVFDIDLHSLHTRSNKYYLGNRIYRFFFEKNMSFVGTSNGLIINDSIKILEGEKVSSINSDIDGNIWISTLGNGVYTLSKDFLKTIEYSKLYNGEVKYAYADSTAFYYTLENNNLYRYSHEHLQCIFDYNAISGNKQLSPYNQIYFINEDHQYYHFGNRNNYIISGIDAPSPVLNTYETDNLHIITSSKSIITTPEYTYIKAFRDIIYFKNNDFHNGNRLKVFNLNYEYQYRKDHPKRVFAFAKSSQKEVWYSTIDSVYKIQNSKVIPQQQFRNIELKSFEFIGSYLVGYTQNNVLIVCSNYDNEKIHIDYINNQNCVWDKIYKIDSSHVLITTNNLYRVLTLYPDSNYVRYSIQAIESPYIPSLASYICFNNKLAYFFRNGNITCIDINTLLEKQSVPKLMFNNLTTKDSNYLVTPIVSVSYYESRIINIKFSTLLFSSKEVLYEYSISKNKNENWVPIKSEEINLFDPGFGTYTIKVKAKTLSSDYCKPISFILVVKKPFWATNLFVILYLISFCVVVWLLLSYLIRLEKTKKDKEHKAEIKQMRSEYKALNALMNPHFIFNTLNDVQGLINSENKVAANKYLRVFADLIRQNMQNIAKEKISLQSEMQLVGNYLLLEKLRFKSALNYNITIEDDVELSEIIIPPLLVQPLVENAIKHGLFHKQSNDNFIHVHVHEDESCVYIEVRDNGVGLSEKKDKDNDGHESLGLKNIKQRIEHFSIIHDQKIKLEIRNAYDSNNNITGTIAIITITYA